MSDIIDPVSNVAKATACASEDGKGFRGRSWGEVPPGPGETTEEKSHTREQARIKPSEQK